MYMLKRRGAKIDPCKTPFFRHQSLLGLLLLEVRVKLLFQINYGTCYGTSYGSSEPCAYPAEISAACRQCYKAAVRSTNMAPAFFASKESSMFCVSKTTWSTVDFKCQNPACSFESKGSTIGLKRL